MNYLSLHLLYTLLLAAHATAQDAVKPAEDKKGNEAKIELPAPADNTKVVNANATETPVQANVTEAAITTTVHPKVNTLESALCKKCSCSSATLILDCSNLKLTKWFTDDEINTLKYGDIKFDQILLNNNELEEVPAFPALSVKFLNFSKNKIVKIQEKAFRELQFIENIDLSHNQLVSKYLTPAVFEGKYSPVNYEPLKNLRSLNLGSNDIHSLDPDLFEHFPNLENLTLSLNPFKVIDALTETAIASLTSLKVLDMSYMQLSILPKYIFHSPRDLETLKLSGNLFKSIPEAIGHAINLKHLDLDENLFTTLEGDNVLPTLPKLEELHLCFCPKLFRIGKGALSNLQNLKMFYASNNPKLSYIHPNSMCRPRKNTISFDFPPLETLHLHNNNLTILEESLFDRWDKINIIDLRKNPWKCDCDNDFVVNVLFSQIIEQTPVLVDDVNCSSPIAWKDVPIKKIHDKKTNLRCEDTYGNHPENDANVLIGMLVGVLVGIPLTLALLVIYRRGCFGLVGRNDPTRYNRAFYSRTGQDDYQI